LHTKLKIGVELVEESIQLLRNSQNGEQRVAGLTQKLVALKLEEIEIDVRAQDFQMKEELALLRNSVDSQLPIGSKLDEGDAAKMRLLDYENKKLRTLLDKAKHEILAAQQGHVPPTPPAEVNGGDSARIKQLEDAVASKDATIAAQAAEINSLQSVSSNKAGAEQEVIRLNKELYEMKQQLERTTSDAKDALAKQAQQLNQDAASKLQALEMRYEQEREEMEDAMAQEVEVSLLALFSRLKLLQLKLKFG